MKIAMRIDAKVFLIKHIERMIKENDDCCGGVENGLALKGALTCIANTATSEPMKNNDYFIIVKDA